MNRVSVLTSFFVTALLVLASLTRVWAVEAVDVKDDITVLDLSAVVENYAGDGDRLQVSTAPGPDGIVRRIEVRARQQGETPGWFVFALANNTDKQMDRYLVAPHFRMSGSGLLKPDLGAQRVYAISTSQGFAPERIPDTEADVFRVTLDPGSVVTFVGELSHKSLPGLNLWEPSAYKDYVNSYTFFRGIVLGIAGLLALFLVILFVVKGAAMFPAAALLAWSVLAYLAIDFGFMGRLFDIPTTYEPIWRAVAEVVFSTSILILLFTYLTLHRWHVRYLHATGIWLIFLIVILGVALYDPSLGAGIARLSMVVTSVAGFAVILYLAFTGFDRAIMLIPTWILLLLWLTASGAAVSGVLENDLVQPALSGGLVLLVLLFSFTIMQHAFSGGILAQGIVSDSERRALAIVVSGDMVWDWDVPRDRIHTSKEAERLLGLKPGALDGHARDWLDWLHTQDKDRFAAMLDAIIEQRRGRVNQDFRLRAEDGHYRWFKLRARPVVGTDGEVVRCVGTLLDITEQRTAEERLLHDAVHDNLTGIANRELLHDRLGAAMTRTQVEGAAKPAVLLVDIDNFRHINDNYGLSIGDSILLTVARRLTRLLKPQDSIARFFGDQFAIILISEQQPERIAVFADSVRKVLKVPIVFGEKELTLSVSIGIAINDVQAHKAASDVVNDSELALYHAKRMGGDRIEPFRPSLRQQGRGRGPLDKDLVSALERNEIDVVFQPIVDLDDRMIKGFEALARWNHPQRGTVPPSDFIPAAERTGLIVPMGIYIMEQAARQLNLWQQKLDGMEALFMSVNVSSQQLMRHDLINDVKTILSRCNVNPGTLKLELTESLVMENPEYASQVLDKLRSLGAGLSLDDFGTGYSSLSHLQHFPFDTLKIDRSFVGHDAGVTPVILQSIVKLAHDLNLNLVAEGIEDEEAVRQLVEMGCPLGQGYLFGKPLASTDAEAMLGKQIEQFRQFKEEAQARRKQAEAEAATRRAEEERIARAERRRQEAEKLERAQAKARAIAAQSLPKAETPAAKKQAETRPAQSDPLEEQLAAGLAADLAGGLSNLSTEESKSPPTRKRDAEASAKNEAGKATDNEQGDDLKKRDPRSASQAKSGAETAAPMDEPKAKDIGDVARSNTVSVSAKQPADSDQISQLDMALESAIGAAAAEAVADIASSEKKKRSTRPTSKGKSSDKAADSTQPERAEPDEQKQVKTASVQADTDGTAQTEDAGSFIRKKVSAASSLFSNPFKKTHSDGDSQTAQPEIPVAKAVRRDEPVSENMTMPSLPKQADMTPMVNRVQPDKKQLAHTSAPAAKVQSQATHQPQQAAMVQNRPVQDAPRPAKPAVPAQAPMRSAPITPANVAKAQPQPVPSVPAQAAPVQGRAVQGIPAHQGPAQTPAPQAPAPQQIAQKPVAQETSKQSPAQQSEPQAQNPVPAAIAPITAQSTPPVTPPTVPATEEKVKTPQATAPAKPKANQGPGRAVSAPKVKDAETDSDLPFAMPDMSNIDQDIANAIQQAMTGGKKD